VGSRLLIELGLVRLDHAPRAASSGGASLPVGGLWVGGLYSVKRGAAQPTSPPSRAVGGGVFRRGGRSRCEVTVGVSPEGRRRGAAAPQRGHRPAPPPPPPPPQRRHRHRKGATTATATATAAKAPQRRHRPHLNLGVIRKERGDAAGAEESYLAAVRTD